MSQEEGAQMVEYGLLLSGIALLATFALFAFGDRVRDLFGPVQQMFP